MSKMTKSETATPAAGRNTDKLLEMDMVADMEVDKLADMVADMAVKTRKKLAEQKLHYYYWMAFLSFASLFNIPFTPSKSFIFPLFI